MEQQYRKCSESPINLIYPKFYHEITLEILRKYPFSGTPEKIADDYWKAYISVFNGLIQKCEQEMNK
ncbi:hypothetical protein ACHOLT_11695 [Desulfitobacterium sp. Sab5]|uniref:hypothetical protein n=1 Tax=Desulfitobacterium nosdiversum TaxID=3375356 RepID=UPI003CF21945